MAQPADSSSWGWSSFSMPSKRANAEPRVNSTIDTTNAQKKRSRPKPKGCWRVATRGGPAAADEQQDLVPGVGHRVDALGEHRARPGEQEAGELGDGDAEVGDERRDDRPSRPARGHGECLVVRRRGRGRSGPSPSTTPAIHGPMASEAVAAGDGAFTTWTQRPAADDLEVVEEGAVGVDGLGPHAGARRHEVARRPTSGTSRCRAATILDGTSDRTISSSAGAPVLGRQAPARRPGREAGGVDRAEPAPRVGVAPEGGHGVGPGVHVAVDAPGEVHPEEREAGVGHRVDEVVHQVRRLGGELEVLAPERDDAGPGPVAAGLGQHVGPGPGAGHGPVGPPQPDVGAAPRRRVPMSMADSTPDAREDAAAPLDHLVGEALGRPPRSRRPRWRARRSTPARRRGARARPARRPRAPRSRARCGGPARRASASAGTSSGVLATTTLPQRSHGMPASVQYRSISARPAVHSRAFADPGR